MGMISVKKCKRCGRKGIFLTLREGDLCSICYQKATWEQALSQSDSLLDDFVVIDVETTGLREYEDNVIQVAAVRYVNYNAVDRFCTYVNPCRPIPPEASRINKITDKMVQSAPTFKNIQDEYFAFIEQSRLVVGYNISFDLKFLRAESGIDTFGEWIYLDVLPCVRKSIPQLSNYKLPTVSKYIGYHATFHNALEDCFACGEVLKHLSKGGFLEDNSMLETCEHFWQLKQERKMAIQAEEARKKRMEKQQRAQAEQRAKVNK